VQASEDETDRYIRSLDNYDFYLTVAKEMRKSGIPPEMIEQINKPRDVFAWIKSIINKKPPITLESSDLVFGDAIESWTKINRLAGSSIDVEFVTMDKEFSRSMADFVANQAVTWISNIELKKINDAISYIKARIDESEHNIRQMENQMTLFKQNNRLLSMDNSGKFAGGEALEREFELAKVEYAQNEKLIRELKHKMEKQQAQVDEYAKENNAATGFKFKTEISQQLAEKEAENRALEARISSVQHQMDGEFGSRVIGLEEDIYEYRHRFELEYGLFENLKKEMFKAEMERVSMQNKVQNLQKAQYSEVMRTVSLTKKMLIAMLASLGVGFVIAYLTELLWPTVKNRHDLDNLGFQFLGSIPDLSYSIRLKSANTYHRFNGRVGRILRFEKDSMQVTAFYKIRTKILYQLEQQKIDNAVIAVVSASTAEGKTFSSTNIAASFASLGKKVLFIDADIRRGGASQLFSAHKLHGLTEVLVRPEMFGQLLLPAMIPNLDVLPAGAYSSNPTELLASKAFQDLVAKLKVLYDFIIVDTSPLLVASDSSFVERVANMVIFVATFNQTQQDAMVRACDSLLEFSSQQGKFYSILNKVNSRYDSLVMMPYRDYYGYGDRSKEIKNA
jgi:capsular exopolysaccharide synthesis family protein